MPYNMFTVLRLRHINGENVIEMLGYSTEIELNKRMQGGYLNRVFKTALDAQLYLNAWVSEQYKRYRYSDNLQIFECRVFEIYDERKMDGKTIFTTKDYQVVRQVLQSQTLRGDG